MIIDLRSWLARLRPAPPTTPPSRDDKLRAARSRRLAGQQARRLRTIPVRVQGAGVVLHALFRSYP
jgi:hypothetical protein